MMIRNAQLSAAASALGDQLVELTFTKEEVEELPKILLK
jgi:hypothetical protein